MAHIKRNPAEVRLFHVTVDFPDGRTSTVSRPFVKRENADRTLTLTRQFLESEKQPGHARIIEVHLLE